MPNLSIKDRINAALNNFEHVTVTGSNSIPFANGLVILNGIVRELENEPPKEEEKDENNI